MPRFTRTCLLRASPRAVYSFHCRPGNARRIQPWFAPVRRLTGPEHIQAGDVVEIETGGGFPARWRVEILQAAAPHGTQPGMLRDNALAGPFPRWLHNHLFTPEGQGTRLTDQVDYEAPGGLWGLLATPFWQAALSLVFFLRHRNTRHCLERA